MAGFDHFDLTLIQPLVTKRWTKSRFKRFRFFFETPNKFIGKIPFLLLRFPSSSECVVMYIHIYFEEGSHQVLQDTKLVLTEQILLQNTYQNLDKKPKLKNYLDLTQNYLSFNQLQVVQDKTSPPKILTFRCPVIHFRFQDHEP